MRYSALLRAPDGHSTQTFHLKDDFETAEQALGAAIAKWGIHTKDHIQVFSFSIVHDEGAH
jgi:hypothetical protein